MPDAYVAPAKRSLSSLFNGSGPAVLASAGGFREAAQFRLRGVPVLLSLFVVAFVLRAVAAVILHQVLIARGGDGFLGYDERGYDAVSWALAQQWRGVGEGVPAGWEHIVNLYTYLGAAIYYVAGHNPLPMKVLNALFGAVVVVFVYLIAWRLFGRLASLLGGLAALLFPSTFLWSLINAKDTLFMVGVMVTLWALTELIATANWRLLVPFALGFALMGALRDYVQAMMGMIAPLTFALQPRPAFPAKWRYAAVVLGMCLLMLWGGGGSQWLGISPARVNQQRSCAAINAESSFAEGNNEEALANCAAVAQGESLEMSGKSVVELIQWLPNGAVHVLAAPFPWQATRAVERAALPDVLAWYLAVILAVVALVTTWRSSPRYIQILLYIGAVALMLSLTQGNLGTLVRHRGMLIAPTLVLSGAGAAYLVWRVAGERVARLLEGESASD